MPHIRTISPRRASGETDEVYQTMKEVGGTASVANIVQLFKYPCMIVSNAHC